MKQPNQDRPLDRLLRNAAPGPMRPPDFSRWLEDHPDQIESYLESASPARTGGRRVRLRRWSAVAALLLVMLGVGFAIGRRQAPDVDLNGLRTDLLAAYEVGYDQLKRELLTQIHRDMQEMSRQTLTVSKWMTEQQISDLMVLIEETRLRDRQRVAHALSQVETNRLRTMARLGQGLQLLAEQSDRPDELKPH